MNFEIDFSDKNESRLVVHRSHVENGACTECLKPLMRKALESLRTLKDVRTVVGQHAMSMIHLWDFLGDRLKGLTETPAEGTDCPHCAGLDGVHAEPEGAKGEAKP